MSLEIPEKIKKLERYTKFGKMPQKTRKNASETSKKESGKILDIRKNTPEKLGKILPKKRDSGGNHFFHLWLHVACTAFNALQIYIINIRVHQNSKKFSKSHGLLIYFCKKMIYFAFSWLGHHFEKNGPCSWENKVKICKIQNLLISHRKVVNTWNKCLIHHFGGMVAWKSGLNFWIWALEVPFSGT